MKTVTELPELNDDGTPRRKYEINEQQESHRIFSITIGLVIVQALVLLKNILFGEDAPQPQRASGSSSDANNANAPGGDDPAVLDEESVLAGKSDREDTGEAMAPLSKTLSMSASIKRPTVSLYEEQIEYASLFPLAANDNATPLDELLGGMTGSPASGSGTSEPEDPVDPPNGDGDDDETDDDPRLVNRLPVVSRPVYLGEFLMNQAVIITLVELLRFASDADGDALAIGNLQTTSGTVTVRQDGSWLFSPRFNDNANVTFTYTIGDGKGTVAQTAYLQIVNPHEAPIVGTEGDDRIVGTPGNDTIDAYGGDDTIIGREGDDVIYGGEGNDRILAGDGDDVVYAGGGDDVVFAGAGNDAVFGGAGDDIVWGEEGDDTLFGEAGNDRIMGGSGLDTISGGDGLDVLDGDSGDDIIDGGAGADTIDGGAGQDIIIAGQGDDHVSGEDGADIFIAAVADGNDSYDGGAGFDSYDISATTASADIDLVLGSASSDDIGTDTVTSIESIAFGSGDDHLTAGEITAILLTNPEPDRFDGGDGDDTYDISWTVSATVVNLATGEVQGDEIGTDILTNFENVNCGSGDDVIIANDSVNTLSGGDGNDNFVFGTVASIGSGQGSRDQILDFAVGDRIDLNNLSDEFADLVDATFEDQNIRRFVLIREQEEFSRPGQIKFKYESFDDHSVTIIQGNMDYDDEAEFELELIGIYDLRDEDFQPTA